MKDLLLALNLIMARLKHSEDLFTELQEFRNVASRNLQPILQGTAGMDNMFLLAGNLDSLKCLIDVEIEEVRRLRVSCEKAITLVTNEAYGPSLAQRLQELAQVDAAIQDGRVSRYVPGLAPARLSFGNKEISISDTETEEDWGYWARVLESHASTVKDVAHQFPSTHPFSPPFGMIYNMLNSTYYWCEEQRKIRVAVEVLSEPNAEYGPDYGSFLRLELLELRRQMSALPRGEEE